MRLKPLNSSLVAAFVLLGMAADAARAQVAFQVLPEAEFAASRSSAEADLTTILLRGTTVRVEGEFRSPATLFVAHVSSGRVASRGETEAFRLDPAASSSTGVVLGRTVQPREVEGLAPLRRVGELPGRSYLPAGRPVSASDFVEQTGVSFLALLDDAFGGKRLGPGGGGYGGGGGARSPGGGGGYGGGGWAEAGDFLVVAIVPTDPDERARATVAPLILSFSAR